MARNKRVARYVALRRELDSLILEEIEPWQRRVLEFVGERPGATSGELVEGLDMDLTHAGTVLKQLTDLGLLRRTERRDAGGILCITKRNAVRDMPQSVAFLPRPA